MKKIFPVPCHNLAEKKYVRILQKNSVSGERERERRRRDYKELIHMIVETSRFKICQVDQQSRDPGKSHCRS